MINISITKNKNNDNIVLLKLRGVIVFETFSLYSVILTVHLKQYEKAKLMS